MVCWYPNLKESQRIFQTLTEYVQYIEIQFPFSDPIADGNIIEQANKRAIENGSNTKKCFLFLEEVMKESNYDWNVCIMTYLNIIFNYWVENFLKRAWELGVYWVIVPDLPYDQNIFYEFYQYAKKYNIHIIYVVSPNTSRERLQKISQISSWCLYAISQNMTTWSSGIFKESFKTYIQNLKDIFHIPIGVWFWISNIDDVYTVNSIADFSIIWSHLLKKYNIEWLQGIHSFFQEYNS